MERRPRSSSWKLQRRERRLGGLQRDENGGFSPDCDITLEDVYILYYMLHVALLDHTIPVNSVALLDPLSSVQSSSIRFCYCLLSSIIIL